VIRWRADRSDPNEIDFTLFKELQDSLV
jgi:hypothetical protein